MGPGALLVAVIALTLGALALDRAVRRRRAAAFRDLASRWNMQYFADDRFSLATRAGQNLSPVHAADLRVRDILCRQGQHGYRYLFTIEYTQGSIAAHRRVCRVVALSDPLPGHQQPRLELAPADRSLPQQYELLASSASEGRTASDGPA